MGVGAIEDCEEKASGVDMTASGGVRRANCATATLVAEGGLNDAVVFLLSAGFRIFGMIVCVVCVGMLVCALGVVVSFVFGVALGASRCSFVMGAPNGTRALHLVGTPPGKIGPLQ